MIRVYDSFYYYHCRGIYYKECETEFNRKNGIIDVDHVPDLGVYCLHFDMDINQTYFIMMYSDWIVDNHYDPWVQL